MRKRGILLVILLLSLLSESVSAQDIIIAGKSYPLIIFIPFVLIVLIWIIILVIWFIRNIHNVALVFYNLGKSVGKFLSMIGFKRISEKLAEIRERKLASTEQKRALLLKKQEKKEKEKEEKKAGPKKKDLTPYLEKINLLENKLPKSKEDIVFKNLAEMIRSFFATLLNLQHQFTEAELQQILEKKKKSLVAFTKKLAELKYSGKPLSKKELQDLIDEFKQIVKHYVKQGWKPGKEEITPMERLVTRDKKILANIKSYIDFLKQESRKSEIESLLEEESRVLSKNVRSIKKRYNKMLKLYVQLSPREKAIIYPQLIDFYNRINKSIFSTVYSKKSKKELEYFENKLKQLKSAPKKEPWFLKLKRSFTSKEEKPKKIAIKGKKIKVKLGTQKYKPKESWIQNLFSRRQKPVKIPKPKKKKVAIKAPKTVKDSFGHKFIRIFKREEVPSKRLKPSVKVPEAPKVAVKEKKGKPLPSMEPLFKRLVNIFRTDEAKAPSGKQKRLKKKIERQELKHKKKELKKRQKEKKLELKKKKVVDVPKEQKEIISELDELTKEPKIEKIDYLAKIKQDIKDGRRYLKAENIKAADKAYDEIRVYFANLEPEDRKKIYDRILKYFEALESTKEKIRQRQLKLQEQENRRNQKLADKRRKFEAKETLVKQKLEDEESSLDSEQKQLEQALNNLTVPQTNPSKTYISKIRKSESDRLIKAIEEKRKLAKEAEERKKKKKKALTKLQKEEEKLTNQLENMKKFL